MFRGSDSEVRQDCSDGRCVLHVSGWVSGGKRRSRAASASKTKATIAMLAHGHAERKRGARKTSIVQGDGILWCDVMRPPPPHDRMSVRRGGGGWVVTS